MKRFLLGLGLAVLFSGVLYVYADTDEGNGSISSGTQEMDSGTDGSDTCPGKCVEPQGSGEQTRAQAKMLRKMGMPEEKIQQWRVVFNAPIYMDSPAALLGQSDTLGLTQDQRQKLMTIEKEARSKADAVLNAEQKDKIRQTDKPVTMMELHTAMCSKMMKHQKMKEGGKERGGMMCPMCPMMDRGPSGKMKDSGTQTTQPSHQDQH